MSNCFDKQKGFFSSLLSQMKVRTDIRVLKANFFYYKTLHILVLNKLLFVISDKFKVRRKVGG